MRKERLAWVVWLIALSMLVAACGKSADTDVDKPDATSQEPAAGGEFVYHVPADPDTFAPFWATSSYSAAVTERVFGDGLMRINPVSKKVEPALAVDHPEVSADGTTYTFKLRQGVKFHDGTEVTAEDIVFSYEILMSDEYQGRRKSTVTELESVKALDQYTIEFKTKSVFAPFLFGSASIYPLPKAKLEGVPIKDLPAHDFWKNPIGAGPWQFVEWKAGQHTLLKRFDDFFEKGQEGYELALAKGIGKVGPWADTMRIRVIPDTNTAVVALENGELSWFGSVEPSHVERLKNQHGDKLNDFDWNRMGYGYQTFNNDKFPTNIKEVRQALSHALNRPDIIKGVMDGRATLPAGFVPPIHWVYSDKIKGYEYDPKKAAQLLEKAGFKKNSKGVYELNGQPLKLQYVATKDSPVVEGIALQSKKDWEALGAEVEVILVDFNTLLDRHLKPGSYHVTFSGLGFTTDPHFSFEDYHSANIRLDAQGVAQGSNTSRYKNEKVDELIERGMNTIDVNERKKIYNEAEQMIVEDAPANWIYVNLYTDLAKKEILGITNADGYGMVNDPQWFVNVAER